MHPDGHDTRAAHNRRMYLCIIVLLEEKINDESEGHSARAQQMMLKTHTEEKGRAQV